MPPQTETNDDSPPLVLSYGRAQNRVTAGRVFAGLFALLTGSLVVPTFVIGARLAVFGITDPAWRHRGDELALAFVFLFISICFGVACVRLGRSALWPKQSDDEHA